MRSEALELLSGVRVRRLVAAWPTVKPSGNDMKDLRAWARAAGVDPREAARWKESLVANGIIFLDGRIEPAAAQYIAGLAMRKVGIKGKESK